jgi:hypothetical protein
LTLFHDVVQVTERLHQYPLPYRSEPVGTSSTIWFEGLDETNGFESSDCLVERPGSETDASEVLDVLHQAVTMFLTCHEAHENEERHSADQLRSIQIV